MKRKEEREKRQYVFHKRLYVFRKADGFWYWEVVAHNGWTIAMCRFGFTRRYEAVNSICNLGEYFGQKNFLITYETPPEPLKRNQQRGEVKEFLSLGEDLLRVFR